MADRNDIEKAPTGAPAMAVAESERASDGSQNALLGWWRSIERRLVEYNLEARGIQRVEPDERHDLRNLGHMQIAILWFSINLAANNITLGMLGPAVFELNFRDSSLLAVFGMLLGCLPTAYTATFGPLSGNRTMIFARYVMGWYPAKLVVILNIIVLLGYALIDAVVAGQILSAVAPEGSMSVVVGIIIVAVLTWGKAFEHIITSQLITNIV